MMIMLQVHGIADDLNWIKYSFVTDTGAHQLDSIAQYSLNLLIASHKALRG